MSWQKKSPCSTWAKWGGVRRTTVIDSEIGSTRIVVTGKAAATMKPKEEIRSIMFLECWLPLAESTSYEKATQTTNRFLHRSDSDKFSVKTLSEMTVRTGRKIDEAYSRATSLALSGFGIDPETGIVTPQSDVPENVRNPTLPKGADISLLEEHASSFNAKHVNERERIKVTGNQIPIEASSEDCVIVSVDDILVKKQKQERGEDKKRDHTHIYDTVINISSIEGIYHITTLGMDEAFRRLVAHLTSYGILADRRLIFITDGATAIKERIEKFFHFREHTTILDWEHLSKKVEETMSMAIKGRKEDKEPIKRDLRRMLWVGNVDGAISYLHELDGNIIYRQNKVTELEGYLDRKRGTIPCYELRKHMGLRNSSNPVEKDNDILVANRQKHHGMSWSCKGSNALASITAADKNGELGMWLRSGSVKLGRAA